MWMLVAESGELVGSCWALNEVPSMIGRAAGCAISLRDSEVSRNHCSVGVRNGGVFFEDQGSRNETLLNGIPARDGNLEKGDKLTIPNNKA